MNDINSIHHRIHGVSMLKGFFAIAVAASLMGCDSGCYYKNSKYSEGSEISSTGSTIITDLKCIDGEWKTKNYFGKYED